MLVPGSYCYTSRQRFRSHRLNGNKTLAMIEAHGQAQRWRELFAGVTDVPLLALLESLAVDMGEPIFSRLQTFFKLKFTQVESMS